MQQRQRLLNLITQFCNQKGSRTFTLKQLHAKHDYAHINVGGKTPEATVRRLLQELRDDKLILFNEQRGSYTLLGQTVLSGETSDDTIANIRTNSKDKKEYLIETHARNRGWVKLAKERLGRLCLYPKCQNMFLKQNQQPYIEVHHIIPLFKGGEDGIWNLSVVCAHHHKMAHFADDKTKLAVEKILRQETNARI